MSSLFRSARAYGHCLPLRTTGRSSSIRRLPLPSILSTLVLETATLIFQWPKAPAESEPRNTTVPQKLRHPRTYEYHFCRTRVPSHRSRNENFTPTISSPGESLADARNCRAITSDHRRHFVGISASVWRVVTRLPNDPLQQCQRVHVVSPSIPIPAAP